jgi:hypothetical protein
MPSPFPGMDPYLEQPDVFPDLHDSFITYLREHLQARLPAPYFAAIGRRVWIELARRSIGPDVNVIHSRPRGPSSTKVAEGSASAVATQPVAVRVAHDEFREPFIEVYANDEQGKRLVTSLELLSLSNKTPGAHGRDLYLRKQREILGSQVHLVEIDLLRGGEHATAVPLDDARDACGSFDYHVSIHHFDDLETYFVYPIRLEDRLPTIAIPLLPGDPPVSLDLQAVLDRCYDAGPYPREIDYEGDALVPPLRAEQRAWAARVLKTEAD